MNISKTAVTFSSMIIYVGKLKISEIQKIDGELLIFIYFDTFLCHLVLNEISVFHLINKVTS